MFAALRDRVTEVDRRMWRHTSKILADLWAIATHKPVPADAFNPYAEAPQPAAKQSVADMIAVAADIVKRAGGRDLRKKGG